MSSSNDPQPMPTPTDGPTCWSMVIREIQADLEHEKDEAKRAALEKIQQDGREREALGIEKYKTPLQANNGRDALIDAYQESLDLLVYLQQLLMEDCHRGYIINLNYRRALIISMDLAWLILLRENPKRWEKTNG